MNKYISTYHKTIKIKHVHAKDNAFTEFGKWSNNKDPKFQLGDHIKTWKCKNIFAKEDPQNWSKDFFIIKEVKNTIPWTYVILDLNDEEIIGTF